MGVHKYLIDANLEQAAYAHALGTLDALRDESTFREWAAGWDFVDALATPTPPPPPTGDVGPRGTPGLPAGWAAERTIAGDHNLGGATLEDAYISGRVTGRGTLRRCHARGGYREWGPGETIIEDSEIGDRTRVSGGDAIVGNRITCRRSRVRGFSDAVKLDPPMTFEDSILEVTWAVGDHSDTMQAYQAEEGLVVVNRCLLDAIATNNTSAKGNAAVFVADYSPLTMHVTNTRMRGGTYTLRLQDGRDHEVVNVVLDDGAWVYGSHIVKAPATVKRWENVRTSLGRVLSQP